MPLLTSYAFQATIFHRLDPFTKALWLVVMLILVFTTSQPLLLAGYIVVLLILSFFARLGLRNFLPMARVMLTFTVFLGIIQVLVQGGDKVIFQLGPIPFYERGIWITLVVVLRIYALGLMFLQFLMWTHPTDLSLMLVRMGIPYKYSMMISLALRFFPVLEKELGKIFEAQQVRGLELHGSVRKMLRLPTVIIPLMLRAFRRSTEVTMAMELRGFGYKRERVFVRTIGLKRLDYAVIGILIALLIGYFTSKIYPPLNLG